MTNRPVGNFVLTVAGQGEYVDARAFVDAVRDALDALLEVDKSVSSVEGGSLQWQIVEATSTSPLTMKMQSVPRSIIDFSPTVLDTFMDGLEQLDNVGTAPRDFSPLALKAVKRFADHYGDGISDVTFATPTRRYRPSPRLKKHVTTLVQDPRIADAESVRPDYFEQGVLDGTVESLIGHGQLYFALYDALSGDRVRCNFAPELSEEVRAAWRKRVAVNGRIRFGGDGHPKDVRVESVIPKVSRDALPQFKGVYINITGGIESSEHVRGLRDDD